ncbi:MAG: hypothetical protein IPJ37_19880 [Bacteroidales bacterium]|nr:hypothetical protein [Bacteroidales bacterium]
MVQYWRQLNEYKIRNESQLYIIVFQNFLIILYRIESLVNIVMNILFTIKITIRLLQKSAVNIYPVIRIAKE